MHFDCRESIVCGIWRAYHIKELTLIRPVYVFVCVIIPPPSQLIRTLWWVEIARRAARTHTHARPLI
jgi:hypothetical protein